jgi:hypothetical protein
MSVSATNVQWIQPARATRATHAPLRSTPQQRRVRLAPFALSGDVAENAPQPQPLSPRNARAGNRTHLPTARAALGEVDRSRRRRAPVSPSRAPSSCAAPPASASPVNHDARSASAMQMTWQSGAGGSPAQTRTPNTRTGSRGGASNLRPMSLTPSILGDGLPTPAIDRKTINAATRQVHPLDGIDDIAFRRVWAQCAGRVLQSDDRVLQDETLRQLENAGLTHTVVGALGALDKAARRKIDRHVTTAQGGERPIDVLRVAGSGKHNAVVRASQSVLRGQAQAEANDVAQRQRELKRDDALRVAVNASHGGSAATGFDSFDSDGLFSRGEAAALRALLTREAPPVKEHRHRRLSDITRFSMSAEELPIEVPPVEPAAVAERAPSRVSFRTT